MWRWYFEMDDAFGSKDSISPSVLYASSSMDQPSASPLSPASMSSACLNSSGTPERCTSTEILDLLKEHVTKEEHCSHAENGSEAVVTPQDFAHCSQLELKNIEESNTGTVKEAAHKWIAVGHIYFFLEDVFPDQPGGGRWLKTPGVLKALFDTPEEDGNYNPLPEERPGGFPWGEGQRLGG
ncbi:UNVERIFIED_CONTAM: hypothetical protein FKN15_041749 [Acipenser sinensis]